MRPPPRKTVAFTQLRASLIGGFTKRCHICFGVRGGDDPVQAVRRSHVNAAVEQQVNEP